ncbi:MAG: SPOR domain-containing protein, partial [Alphaproteobacteria bacterium]
IAAVLVAAFGGLVWYAYGLVSGGADDGAPPMITADETPEKVRPADPGGLDIANQDSTVFERIDPESGESSVEQLLPPPAEALPQPAAAGEDGEGGPEVPDLPTAEQVAEGALLPPASAAADAETEAVLADIAEAAEAVDTAGQTGGASNAATVTAAESGAATATETATGTAAASASATAIGTVNTGTANGAGAWRIQLAAVREEDRARDEWQRMQGKYPAVLGSLTLHLERADLGSRGVFWRIRAGDWADKAAAEQACEALAAQNQACLVISR